MGEGYHGWEKYTMKRGREDKVTRGGGDWVIG